MERNVLLLTGTINPKVFFKDGKSVYLMDEKLRLKQYEEMIYQYIMYTKFDDIIFVENSGYRFDYERYEKIATQHTKRFEFISMRPNVDKIVKLGKSYGEAELIDYAMKNSKLIKEHDVIYKITGRVFLKNWKRILHTKDNGKNEFISINKVHWCKTDFFKVNKNDYFKYIYGIGEKCNENKGIDLEKVYYNELKNTAIEIESFKVYPRLEGMYGTTGQKYNKPIWKIIIFNILIKFKFFNIK